MNLSEAWVGFQGYISRISGSIVYRQKLLALGLTPGTAFYFARKAPLGDPIEITVRGFSLCLRQKEAQCIEISEISIC